MPRCSKCKTEVKGKEEFCPKCHIRFLDFGNIHFGEPFVFLEDSPADAATSTGEQEK